MNTYDVHFRTDLHSAARHFVADTPQQALELAMQFAGREPTSLDFEYIEAAPSVSVNEIEVYDEQHNSVAIWFDENMRLRAAAPDLLYAAEKILDRWQNGDIEEVIHELAIAVDAAKGGAA